MRKKVCRETFHEVSAVMNYTKLVDIGIGNYLPYRDDLHMWVSWNTIHAVISQPSICNATLPILVWVFVSMWLLNLGERQILGKNKKILLTDVEETLRPEMSSYKNKKKKDNKINFLVHTRSQKSANPLAIWGIMQKYLFYAKKHFKKHPIYEK